LPLDTIRLFLPIVLIHPLDTLVYCLLRLVTLTVKPAAVVKEGSRKAAVKIERAESKVEQRGKKRKKLLISSMEAGDG
jgi:hypothetical protein